MDNFQEFTNAVDNLRIGWTNQWAFIDQRNIILERKNFAFKNKKALQKQGYDVDQIFKELEEFENCCNRQNCLTDDPEEKIVLAAFEYGNKNKPIIYLKYFDFDFDIPYEKEKSADTYKFNVYINYVSFYLFYKEHFDLFNTFKTFLDFNEILLKKYFNNKENFNSSAYTIDYLKFLIKKKDFKNVKFFIDNYTIEPKLKKDILDFEKIKIKLKDYL